MANFKRKRSFLLRVLVLSIIIFGLASCTEFSFTVERCPSFNGDTVLVGDFVYLDQNMSALFCPSTQGPNRWVYKTPAHTLVFAKTNYSVSEVCFLNQTNGTLLYITNTLFSSLTRGNLSFLVDGDLIDFEYGSPGLYTLFSSNYIHTVGESFSIIFVLFNTPTPPSATLMKRTSSGGLEPVDSSTFIVLDPSFKQPCTNLQQGERPRILEVSVIGVNLSDSGTYVLSVGVYRADFNITVLESPSSSSSPSPSISPTQSTSIITSTTTSSTSTVSSDVMSLSPSPTVPGGDGEKEPQNGLLIIVSSIAFAVVIFIVLIVIIGFCIYVYKKRCTATGAIVGRSDPEVVPGYSSDKEDTKEESFSTEQRQRGPSIGSVGRVSLNQQGRLSSTSSGQSSTRQQEDFTGIYCNDRHSYIGTQLTEKLGEKCQIFLKEDEIVIALEDNFCNEMYFFADPDDEILRAVFTRGIPGHVRHKVKWWQFVGKDKTPNNVIEVDGFKIVQVEGDPHSFDTLQLGILKTENPPITHKDIGISKHYGNGTIPERASTDDSTHSSPRVGGEHKRGHDEHDGDEVHKKKTHDDEGTQKGQNLTGDVSYQLLEETIKARKILEKIANKQEEGNEIQKQHFEQSKDQTDILRDTHKLAEESALQDDNR